VAQPGPAICRLTRSGPELEWLIVVEVIQLRLLGRLDLNQSKSMRKT
jgi:hypothetical protein